MDDGESIIKAMIREAKEEIGIDLDVANLELAHVMNRLSMSNHRVGFFFKASSWNGKVINAEPNKCDELRWVNIDNLPNNVIPYIRSAIDSIIKGELYSDFGW